MRSRRSFSASTAHSPRFVFFESQLEASEEEQARVETFIATMPERYGQEFSGVVVRQHAEVVLDRGRQPIHAGRFLGGGATGPGVCIVAIDDPSVLAMLSTALTVEGFDIVRGDVFRRKASSIGCETVGLFWVRRLPSEHLVRLHERELAMLTLTLRHWWGKADVRRLIGMLPTTTSPGRGETSLRFRAVRGIPRVTLELQTSDRPGLLARVTSTLAIERVHVVAGRIRTRGLRVYDYFDLVDADGSCLSVERLNRVELAILNVLDPSTNMA